jgi:hypothetical protein
MALDEEDEDYGEEGNSEFAALAAEAFPDQEFDPGRLTALKQLIKLCAKGDEAEPEDDEEPAKGGGDALALVFGKPKKK